MKTSWPLALLALILVGCGGGGGGGHAVILVGRVLWIETNAAPDPAATVSASGNATTTDLIDGSFTLTAAVGETSVTVSYSNGGPPIVFTFSFPPASGTVDLGDVYIGPEKVTVHGTVKDASDDSLLPGALVKLAGRSATTDANGEFNLLNVAYSSSNSAAFGDLIGEVSKPLYVTRQFNPPTVAIGGVVEVGSLLISPESQDQPPPFPANVTGTVLPVNFGAGSTVQLLQGVTVIRTTTADGSGQFGFFAGVGTYTVHAFDGSGHDGTAGVTVTSQNVQVVVNVTYP